MAMPHPQSPHRPASVDVAGGLGTVLPSQDSFCTPGPLLSSSSPKSTIMSTTFAESAPTKDQHLPSSLMGLSDTSHSAIPWAGHYDPNAPQMTQNGNGYGPQCPLPAQYMDSFTYSQNAATYNSNFNNFSYPSFGQDPSCPRSYTNGLPMANSMSRPHTTESHPPSEYLLEAPKNEAMDLSDQGSSHQLLQYNTDYDSHIANIKVEESAYDSPYNSVPGTPCSTPQDDLSGMACQRNDEGAIDKEQPYAQLIYKALLAAPGHTMILRDIYNWFKENTDKAADKETKGWQNSIRHNLSMNGAFEKVDQPCEDSRKGFMWKLTDQAIREGVKSTTRYRSKQPNKRGHRSSNPLPQRQASGAKGGHASKRAARLRRSQRGNDAYGHLRSDPYMCSRSVPAVMFGNSPSYDPCAFDMPYPDSPYYGSDMGYQHPLDRIDELGSHPNSLLGSPLLGHVQSSDVDHSHSHSSHTNNSNNNMLSYSTPGPMPTHGLPLTRPYDHNPRQIPPYRPFEKNHVYMRSLDQSDAPLFYATDDSMSTASNASEPPTPETQGECYMGMGMDMDMAHMGQNFLLDEMSAAYQE